MKLNDWDMFRLEDRVLFEAVNSETGERMVVYLALYGEGKVWVRPASMWEEQVEADGVTQPRFAFESD